MCFSKNNSTLLSSAHNSLSQKRFGVSRCRMGSAVFYSQGQTCRKIRIQRDGMHTLCHGFKHVRLKLQILTISSESVIMIVERAYEAHMCDDLSIYSRDNQSLFIANGNNVQINRLRDSDHFLTTIKLFIHFKKCSNPGYITLYIFISPCAFYEMIVSRNTTFTLQDLS